MLNVLYFILQRIDVSRLKAFLGSVLADIGSQMPKCTIEKYNLQEEKDDLFEMRRD